ncbi:type IV pilus twitching motility protein PilT [Catelliglobosispora koreensis]|uniref:type IV pilus twitching motility protein PilT n=1 Tax=Catelliglobosispora koreensis TaxID=129052 RepID=UPI000376DCE0|nr:PilT/PilU family type 4a pilus ATPase [Catelliglobosispora koreensis]
MGPRIDALLEQVWQAGGTDLLLTPGAYPQMRVHGTLRPVPGSGELRDSDTDGLLGELIAGLPRSAMDDRMEHDFAITWRDLARLRCNAFRQRSGIAVAVRVIPRAIRTIHELGLPPVLGGFARRHQGLVLVTGPTGSGKSTTLAAMIDQINSERACHIITIEDPIEYLHDHKRAMVSQREVGVDTRTFPDALRSALRADPDVLLVGEMRDLDSIRFALTIAETGHLVFASLHTNDTAQALARIIDVFPAEQQEQIRTQLAAALTGIVYQRLLPRSGGGLVPAVEVLLANSAVRNLIKENKTHQLRNVLLTSQQEGMMTFEKSLSILLRAGAVTYEDAVAYSLHPKEVENRPMLPAGASA